MASISLGSRMYMKSSVSHLISCWFKLHIIVEPSQTHLQVYICIKELLLKRWENTPIMEKREKREERERESLQIPLMED